MFCIRCTIVFAASVLLAQVPKEVIVTAGRAGIVEIIEPSTLETLARIHFKFPDGNVGLDRVSVSMDGAKLYVEGPIPSDPRGCCVLYSVDLVSMQTSIAASVFGSSSRQQFVFSDGLVFPVSSIFAGGLVKVMDNSLLHLSPGFSECAVTQLRHLKYLTGPSERLCEK